MFNRNRCRQLRQLLRSSCRELCRGSSVELPVLACGSSAASCPQQSATRRGGMPPVKATPTANCRQFSKSEHKVEQLRKASIDFKHILLPAIHIDAAAICQRALSCYSTIATTCSYKTVRILKAALNLTTRLEVICMPARRSRIAIVLLKVAFAMASQIHEQRSPCRE